jgi:DnaJ family protein A protein 2
LNRFHFLPPQSHSQFMIVSRRICRGFSSSAKSASTTRLYELLNVTKNSSDEEIKKAYKKAALEHHPDRGGDSDKFKEISNAYTILSDPQKRQVYDQFGEAGVDQGGPGNPYGGGSTGGYHDPMDIFSQVFGGSARRRQSASGGLMRGRDAVYNLEVSLDEIANGTNRTIAYNRDVACKNCGGKGATKIDTCKRCGGSGVVLTRQNIGFLVHMQTACPDCGGQGYTVPKDGHCSPCHSSGVVSQKESFQVTVSPGTANGHEFKFSGKADQLPGHTAGDVIVRVRTRANDKWKRLSSASPDLVMKHQVSLAEALGGFELSLARIGDKAESRLVSVPGRVVAPGDVYIAAGLGLPRVNGTTRGNLYIKFDVVFPKNIDGINEIEKRKLASIFDPKNRSNGSPVEGGAASVIEPVTVKDAIRRVNEVFEEDTTDESANSNRRRETTHHPAECQQQ